MRFEMGGRGGEGCRGRVAMEWGVGEVGRKEAGG